MKPLENLQSLTLIPKPNKTNEQHLLILQLIQRKQRQDLLILLLMQIKYGVEIQQHTDLPFYSK